MCGIVGYFDRDNSRRSADMQSIAGAMADCLAHRGPNDQGTWADADSGIALGHRRLSILDLSMAGHQPMISGAGRFVIAFNGEIYNYLTIQNELQHESGGKLRLRGGSDTEVILAAFDRWGVEASVARMEGMFAIAAWDRQERALWLVRDRLGKKPLYYGHFGATVMFASELKAFRAHPDFHPEIACNAVSAYFRFGNVPAPLSIYRGVKKLPAASWLRISQDGAEREPHEYWSLTKLVRSGQASPFEGSDHEAIDELDDRLRNATRQRMIASDVPVGLFLSGGVDSSTVTALAQVQSSIPIRTFSIGMSSAEYDESKFAGLVAKHLGTDHTSRFLTPAQAMSAVVELPAIFDEPFADSSAIPTLLVSRLARNHVTVALSGDGGDEMFGGYNRHIMAASLWPIVRRLPIAVRHQTARVIEGLNHPRWDDAMRTFGAIVPRRFRMANLPDKVHKIIRALEAGNSSDLYLSLISYWQNPSDILNPDHLTDWTPPDVRDWFDEADPATSMMLADARLYMHGDIMVKVDRASMAAGLEVRNPFLDSSVVEFACTLPLRLRIRDGTGKWIVRRVMDRYIPPELTMRPKMGFAIPLTSWLRGPLRDWAEDLIGDGSPHGEWLNRSAVQAVWHNFLSGDGGLTDKVWSLLMFQAWMKSEESCATISLHQSEFSANTSIFQ